MGKYIDGSGLSHFMGIIKSALAGKSDTTHTHSNYVSDVKYDTTSRKLQQSKNGGSYSDVVTLSKVATSNSYSDLDSKPTIPSANTTATNIKMNGTQSAGSLATFAKADHVHPSDDSKVPTTRKVNGKALSADVTLYATDIALASDDDTYNVYEAFEAMETTFGETLGDLYVDGVSLFEDGDMTSMHYAECETAAATAAKAVSLAGFSLYEGAMVYVKFTVTNTAAVANLTLNVNSTGAKAIKYRGGNLPSVSTLTANRLYAFVYDGTNWELVGDLDTNSDTKNTAGSTDSSSKLFIIGATSQAANPQTYSQDTAYVGTDGHLYSNSVQVVNLSASQALTNKTYNGYTLAAACAKGVDTSIAAGSTSTNVPTTAAVVNYMTSVAGALVYKGTVGTGGTVTDLPANHTKGWYYVVKAAGTYAGFACEAGDMIICNTSGTSANNAHWDAIQSNIEVLSNSEIDALWAAA